MKPLLVGEAPGPRTNGQPFGQDGASGRRLARLAGVADLAEVFECVNLLDQWPGASGKASAFPLAEAMRAAARILGSHPPEQLVVCAGLRVWAAFDLPGTAPVSLLERDGRRYALIPHPSGVNRWWNQPGAEEQVATWLRATVGLCAA